MRASPRRVRCRGAGGARAVGQAHGEGAFTWEHGGRLEGRGEQGQHQGKEVCPLAEGVHALRPRAGGARATGALGCRADSRQRVAVGRWAGAGGAGAVQAGLFVLRAEPSMQSAGGHAAGAGRPVCCGGRAGGERQGARGGVPEVRPIDRRTCWLACRLLLQLASNSRTAELLAAAEPALEALASGHSRRRAGCTGERPVGGGASAAVGGGPVDWAGQVPPELGPAQPADLHTQQDHSPPPWAGHAERPAQLGMAADLSGLPRRLAAKPQARAS